MTNILIFGATGNLTIKKLMPALSEVYNKNSVEGDLRIIAVSRREYDRNQYIEFLKKNIKDLTSYFGNLTEGFLSAVEYFPLNFSDEGDFKSLVDELNEKNGGNSNYLIYFATSPEYFRVISESLKKYPLKLAGGSWKRLVIEKPFGRDLSSALEANKTLEMTFSSDEIFRIDHYLGKEMIQNIMCTRFANRIFEDIWDSDGIESVQIVVAENRGIENRGAYYDNSGAFRDMIQSHLLQILAIVAMGTPKSFDAKHITKEKVKILRNLTEFSKKEIDEDLVIGQYKGYHEEKGVSRDSMTETFVALKCRFI